MERDIGYEKDNIGYDEQYPEGGIKCKNYPICGAVLPNWWYECKGRYLCTGCDIVSYGKLKFDNAVECPICLNNDDGLQLPHCAHKICVKCFKRCVYGSMEGEPQFPYPEVEEEYWDDDGKDPKWRTDYPLIEIHNKEWSEWDLQRERKRINEQNLRKCPVCRTKII